MLGAEWGGVAEIARNRVEIYSAAQEFPSGESDWPG